MPSSWRRVASDRRFVEGLAEVRTIAVSHGQTAIKAWPLFACRMVKGMAQRLVKRCVPTPLYQLLRSWINADYRAVPSGAGSPSQVGTSQ